MTDPGESLDELGYATVPGLVAAPDCAALAARWDEDGVFRKRVVMQKHGFGRGEYRYFDYPLPPLVQALRASLYAALAPIANRWRAQLGLPSEFPPTLEAYLDKCHGAGQTRPTPLVLRYGKYFFISPEKVQGAERWAERFGSMGIFASRLLPVVRHLIGIPAGIIRMNYRLFSFFTVLGSAIWCAVLCWVGVKAGQDEKLMRGELHQITLWLVSAVIVLGALYYFLVHRYMKGKSPADRGTP